MPSTEPTAETWDIPLFWSAGGGRGWPHQQVIDALQRECGFPDECIVYHWDWRMPFYVDRQRPNAPVVVTCDPLKWDIVTMLGQDCIFLPRLMPEAQKPPLGYAERYGGCGDPWLQYAE